MKTNNWIVALLLCVGVVSVMLFSHVYIACRADHDCIGEGCQICATIENCEQNLKNLVTVVALAIAAALSCFFCVCMVCSEKTVFQNTLVTLKVKLSN